MLTLRDIFSHSYEDIGFHIPLPESVMIAVKEDNPDQLIEAFCALREKDQEDYFKSIRSFPHEVCWSLMNLPQSDSIITAIARPHSTIFGSGTFGIISNTTFCGILQREVGVQSLFDKNWRAKLINISNNIGTAERHFAEMSKFEDITLANFMHKISFYCLYALPYETGAIDMPADVKPFVEFDLTAGDVKSIVDFMREASGSGPDLTTIRVTQYVDSIMAFNAMRASLHGRDAAPELEAFALNLNNYCQLGIGLGDRIHYDFKPAAKLYGTLNKKLLGIDLDDPGIVLGQEASTSTGCFATVCNGFMHSGYPLETISGLFGIEPLNLDNIFRPGITSSNIGDYSKYMGEEHWCKIADKIQTLTNDNLSIIASIKHLEKAGHHLSPIAATIFEHCGEMKSRSTSFLKRCIKKYPNLSDDLYRKAIELGGINSTQAEILERCTRPSDDIFEDLPIRMKRTILASSLGL